MSLIILEQELKDYRVPIYEKISDSISDEIILYYWPVKGKSSFKILKEGSVNVQCVKTKVLDLFKKVYLPFWPVKKIFNRHNTVVIRGNIRNLFLLPYLLLTKLLGIRTIVWGQAISRKRVFAPYRNIVDFFYLLILKLCDAYVLYDKMTKDIVRNYVEEQKLFIANNTIDTDKEFKYLQRLHGIGKDKVKEELGMHYGIALCFIGRLTKRKKLKYLIYVFERLSKEVEDIGLYIIGKGPEEEKLREEIKSRKLLNVELIGPKYEYEAAKYLFACDIMVMPGWLGLAVNHSLIYGLPIVSQKKDDFLTGHAPEAVHLKHCYNGWFAEYGNKEDMVRGIKKIIGNLEGYSANAADYAQKNLGIERMVGGFLQAYKYVNKNNDSMELQ